MHSGEHFGGMNPAWQLNVFINVFLPQSYKSEKEKISALPDWLEVNYSCGRKGNLRVRSCATAMLFHPSALLLPWALSSAPWRCWLIVTAMTHWRQPVCFLANLSRWFRPVIILDIKVVEPFIQHNDLRVIYLWMVWGKKTYVILVMYQ